MKWTTRKAVDVTQGSFIALKGRTRRVSAVVADSRADGPRAIWFWLVGENVPRRFTETTMLRCAW